MGSKSKNVRIVLVGNNGVKMKHGNIVDQKGYSMSLGGIN